MSEQFKVGDEVVITGNGNGVAGNGIRHYLEIGSVCLVLSANLYDALVEQGIHTQAISIKHLSHVPISLENE